MIILCVDRCDGSYAKLVDDGSRCSARKLASPARRTRCAECTGQRPDAPRRPKAAQRIAQLGGPVSRMSPRPRRIPEDPSGLARTSGIIATRVAAGV